MIENHEYEFYSTQLAKDAEYVIAFVPACTETPRLNRKYMHELLNRMEIFIEA